MAKFCRDSTICSARKRDSGEKAPLSPPPHSAVLNLPVIATTLRFLPRLRNRNHHGQGDTQPTSNPNPTADEPQLHNLANSASSLLVTMCCYHTGKVEQTTVSVADTTYFAISQVWGIVKWRKVPGMIDGEILVSEEKPKFLVEQLPSIVGHNYLWMDVLCVDQHDKAARVAVTQNIPTIFRQAQRAIV